MKTRTFSIFLLKLGYDAKNSLKPDNQLIDAYQAENLPQGASLFISDKDSTTPWWVSYFSINGNLRQESKGAIIFIPIRDRFFALTFGHVYHNLLDVSYEYDFGLKVTLNSLEPNELKSADIVDPGSARRKRMQVPITSDLTYLDFDSNSEILKSLTGKVKHQYKDIFKNATGSTNLKVGINLSPNELVGLCEQLLDLYSSDDYLESFPNIQKIRPEKDPQKIAILDESLLRAFINNDNELSLSIPDIVDYGDNINCIFKGRKGISKIYTDISLSEFYDYLDGMNIANLDINALNDFSMNLCNQEGNVTKTYSIYRSLIYDVKIDGENIVYHLCEGEWYKVDGDYLYTLKEYINQRCQLTELPPYNHDVIDLRTNKKRYSEEKYNEDICEGSDIYICLDQTDISPDGHSQIEPCDIIRFTPDNECVFHHIKISSRSSQLSHLFNQGVNSIQLLILEECCRENLKSLVSEKTNHENLTNFTSAIDSKNYKVEFGIITRKDPQGLSENLPLFSKISLMRALKALELTQTKGIITFIQDNSQAKEAYSKYPRVNVVVSQDENGKKIVVVDNRQQYPQGTKIHRCSKEISNSPIGSRFIVYVKDNGDGVLSTNYSWESEPIPPHL